MIERLPEGSEKAHECFRILWEEGKKLGCFPYRINIAAMDPLRNQGDPSYWRLLRTLKDAVDPDHIFSPGRYEG